MDEFEKEKIFKWMLFCQASLAVRILKDAQNCDGEWSDSSEWSDIPSNDKLMFMRAARDEAVIPSEEYKSVFKDCSFPLGEWLQEFEVIQKRRESSFIKREYGDLDEFALRHAQLLHENE